MTNVQQGERSHLLSLVHHLVSSWTDGKQKARGMLTIRERRRLGYVLVPGSLAAFVSRNPSLWNLVVTNKSYIVKISAPLTILVTKCEFWSVKFRMPSYWKNLCWKFRSVHLTRLAYILSIVFFNEGLWLSSGSRIIDWWPFYRLYRDLKSVQIRSNPLFSILSHYIESYFRSARTTNVNVSYLETRIRIDPEVTEIYTFVWRWSRCNLVNIRSSKKTRSKRS